MRIRESTNSFGETIRLECDRNDCRALLSFVADDKAVASIHCVVVGDPSDCTAHRMSQRSSAQERPVGPAEPLEETKP